MKLQGWPYVNVLPNSRRDNFFSISYGLLRREFRVFRLTANSFRPDVMIGTSAEIAHVGKLRNIPALVVNEDDSEAVPLFAGLAYPFATQVLAPFSCNVGKWSFKKIPYDGYHELAYLHPHRFRPSRNLIEELLRPEGRFFILRFAQLGAHHDKGKTGITTAIAEKVVGLLKPFGRVYITSERPLEPQFERYRLNLNPQHLHHALYFSDLYIGDSQTMAAEAAVLGTPSIRFNDFVGKLGYLEELEHKYGLTIGIKTSEPQRLYSTIEQLLQIPNLKAEWQARRRKMLAEKIDVTAFMVWFIENYPESATLMQRDPSYQLRFKSTSGLALKSQSLNSTLN